MKKVLSFNVFALFCLIATAQVSKTINVSRAGNLSALLTDTERNTITNLTVTGNIDYRDFIFKSMKELKVLDISGVVIDESIKSTRDLLLGIYRDNPKELGQWGFEVDDSVRAAAKKQV